MWINQTNHMATTSKFMVAFFMSIQGTSEEEKTFQFPALKILLCTVPKQIIAKVTSWKTARVIGCLSDQMYTKSV